MFATTATDLLVTMAPAGTRTCLHCGDRCGTGGVTTGDGAFCCHGCESVFSLIKTHGLAAFYTCDVGPGLSQKAADGRDRARFAILDDPDIASRFLSPGPEGPGRHHVRFAVPALHCASCVWLIEQLWRFDPGICRSEVDLLRRTVHIAFRPEATTLRAIAERLASLGYEPLLDAEPAAAGMPATRRGLYLRLGVSGFAFGNVMLFSIPRYANGGALEPAFQHLFDALNIVFAIPVLLYSASPYFTTAWAALRTRTMALEIPVALGLVALFGRSLADIATGRGEGFLDSFSGLVFFLLIGRLCQQKAFDGIAFDRTLRSFFPLSVRVEATGDLVRLTPIEQLRPGDILQLRPQEVVPTDALLLDDSGAIDYAFVTGESTPAIKHRGEAVSAGGRVADRTLRLAVTRPVSQSRLADLWQHPVFAKTKAHWLMGVTTRFGWWFTILAIALAAGGAIAWWPDTRSALSVATAVLIIACPCALTLAAPITLGTAMGVLGRAGCYLKNPSVALDLSRIDTIAFDKTGTLTTVQAAPDQAPATISTSEWLSIRRLAAESVHPVSRAYAAGETASSAVSDFQEFPGLGVSALVGGRRVVIGRAAFVQAASGRVLNGDASSSSSPWAWVDGAAPCLLPISHPERPGMSDAIRSLRRSHEIWLLSGDRWREAGRFAALFDEHVRCELSPEEKLAAIREQQAGDRRVLMVGDGLNDAGALAAADVGLAVSDETACLVPACDAVIRGDRLRALPAFLRYARRARRVVVLCFAVSVVYNAFGIWLALTGQLTPLVTAILMPISSLTVVGLSVGLMRLGAARVIHS